MWYDRCGLELGAYVGKLKRSAMRVLTYLGLGMYCRYHPTRGLEKHVFFLQPFFWVMRFGRHRGKPVEVEPGWRCKMNSVSRIFQRSKN